MDAPPHAAPTAITDAVRGIGLTTVFQPVVDLHTRHVVGYEALSRWAGTGLTADAVFAAAHTNGDVNELDARCRRSAIDAALDADLGPDALLLINVEPGTGNLGDDAEWLPCGPGASLRPVLEFTERDLLTHPATLLAQIARARERGCSVALDDVGAHPDSLALLDLVMPDIIKLDLALVQQAPAHDRTRTLAAVIAHRERTGAVVLAEGIETEQHLGRALAFGASVGQGWLFGRPAALPKRSRRHHAHLDLLTTVTPTPRTPADLLGANVRTAEKRVLTAFSRHIEAQADNPADPAVVIAALQSARHISSRTREIYENLARRSPFVAVLGVGVPEQPAPRVRGTDLHPSDPLTGEWTVAALGAQTAAALIARDRGDNAPEPLRTFDFLVTYDRDLVTRTMRSLLSRVL